jgi:DNA ligase 1
METINYSRLYTVDSKGNTRVFDCTVTVVDTSTCLVTTSTGLLSGKLIDKVTKITSGKQKRTVEEQAMFVAKSLLTEKEDEGYKSIEVLAARLVSKGIPNLYHERIIPLANQHLPSWYKTNAYFDELPMLAHKFKDIKKPNFPYIGQPKLDGVRCIVKYDAGTVKLISRGGQYYKIPHLTDQLIRLFEGLEAHYLKKEDILLDGEIYKHGTPLQDISGAARREEIGMFGSNSWLEYHIYDVINKKVLNMTQKTRLELFPLLQTLINTELNLSSINILRYGLIYNQDDVRTYHDKYVERGYEGLILRHPDSVYEFNQRSKSLLKVKEYQDEEFRIIGCEIDPGKTIEESFCFVLENNINDKQMFKARPTGTAEMKKKWYDTMVDIIGERATVRFFARSNDGLPTQGVVRHRDTEVLVKHIRPNGE